MVTVGLCTVVLLDVGHQVVDEVLTEDITTETHLRGNLITAFLRCGARHRGGSVLKFQLHGVAIGQYDNHLLRLFFGEQIVEDIVHAAYFIIDLLRVGGTADEVEHRVFLLHVGHIGRGQIYNGVVGSAKALGVIVDILNTTMRYVQDVVGQSTCLRLHFQQAILKALIGEVLGILRIHHADAVNDIAVGIHVGGNRTESHRPQTVGTTCHLFTAGKLHIDKYGLGRIVLVLERHCSVIICSGLCHAHHLGTQCTDY